MFEFESQFSRIPELRAFIWVLDTNFCAFTWSAPHCLVALKISEPGNFRFQCLEVCFARKSRVWKFGLWKFFLDFLFSLAKWNPTFPIETKRVLGQRGTFLHIFIKLICWLEAILCNQSEPFVWGQVLALNLFYFWLAPGLTLMFILGKLGLKFILY